MGLAVVPVVALGEGSSPESLPTTEEPRALSSLESSLITEAEKPQAQEEAKQSGPEASKSGSSSESSSSTSTTSGGQPPAETSQLESSLVTPGSPTASEEVQAEREAKLASPEAVVEREVSRTKFEKLDSAEAAKAAGEAFPVVVNEPAGGPPKLPAGESISHFSAVNVAQVVGGSGKHSVIESTAPMAIQTMHGLVPIDLSLNEEGDAYKPKTPLVDVQIPKQLGQGVSVANTGVSLVPVNGQGSALGGSEGSVDGATVMFANTQTDTDTLVKPTMGGFEMDTVLRSINSPTELDYKVIMPRGESLVEEQSTGSMHVVDEGATIAQIVAPTAHDAEGTPVPVSMNVKGNTLSVTVASNTGEYKWPIVVDPEFYWSFDGILTGGCPALKYEGAFCGLGHSNWVPITDSSGIADRMSYSSETEEQKVEIFNSGSYTHGQYGGIQYETKGESRIFDLAVEGRGELAGSGTDTEYWSSPGLVDI